MSALDRLPQRIVDAALNESVYLGGVWEADAEAKVKKSGKVIGYVTNDDGDRIRVTAEYVEGDR
ncbi:hypothetical protein IT072_02585 [Leifsonia sp. ZF2019]|uniref:hypothetical protein n=1 Tax=Leifsonia sp. ZF2019 TaxID=2781978 RepID=UPI001CBAA061|nr:hypothetical protein [Leifsonia sp. ZF2019]UAJ79984.1 hypothetical protein IT072_02585 [Leifsonia sp. ZF2019]